jgi:hypothetical protein
MTLHLCRTQGVRSRSLGRLLAAGALCAALAACQSVQVTPVSYTPLAASAKASEIQLAQPVTAILSNENTTTLQAGSRWVQVGTLQQGDVYKPATGVFMTNARRVRETWIVIAKGAVQGFYFPGETLYTPAVHSTTMVLEKN